MSLRWVKARNEDVRVARCFSVASNRRYCAYPSFKLSLSEDEQQRCDSRQGKREIDVLAYRVNAADVLLVECKSFLDSEGVHFPFRKPGKYRLFDDSKSLVFDAVKRAVGQEHHSAGFARQVRL